MTDYTPRKAVREQLWLRMAITGVDHTGKTYNGLQFAGAFGGTICVIDTHAGDSQKYLGLPNIPEFDLIVMEEYTPEEYIAAIHAAHGYDVLVVDTVSYEWITSLAIKDALTLASSSQNSYTEGWHKVTPRHNNFIQALRAFPGHLIVTVREKIKYIIESDGKGGVRPRKVGMAPIQRQDFGYGWDIVCAFDSSNTMTVEARKGVGLDIHGLSVRKPGPEFMEPIKAWLGAGRKVYTLRELFDAVKAAGLEETHLKAQMLALAHGVTRYADLSTRQREDLYLYFSALTNPQLGPISSPNGISVPEESIDHDTDRDRLESIA